MSRRWDDPSEKRKKERLIGTIDEKTRANKQIVVEADNSGQSEFFVLGLYPSTNENQCMKNKLAESLALF